MQRNIISVGSTLFVITLHLLLGWGLSKLTFNHLEFEDIGNLQMVEVNLGVESPKVEEDIPEPEPEPEVIEDIKEEIITVKTPDPVPDLVKPVEKPKPEKKEKPKPKPKKSEPKVQKEKVKPEKVAKKTENNTLGTAANTITAPAGNANGVAGSTSTQGNAKTSATLGAGYGKAMTGRCSDISDEADDEGSVKLQVSISESGKATEVEIVSSSGIKRLDNQAKRMASSHTYSPARANGKAVSGQVTFTIHFKCGNAA
ncbi:energy transducer TonB [Ursidibacter arcticus]